MSRAAVAPAVRRHPALAAGALFVLLGCAMVAQGLLPGRTLSPSDYLWSTAPWIASAPQGLRDGGANGELADAVAAFQPFLLHTRAALPSLPLWNGSIMAGRPFLANAQSAVFSPFSLPAYVLPFWWSLGFIAALKLAVAATGAFALSRALGARTPGALLAGIAFGLSLYMVTWLAWPLSSVWALLPWVLVAIDRVVRRPDALGIAVLAAVVAMQFFAGHPESSLHLGVAAVLFAALRLSRGAAGGRRRAAVATVTGLAAGGGLAAIVLVPFLELLAHSADIADRAGRPAGHLPRSNALALVMPEYWGRPTQVMTLPFINARAFYVGALPLMLAGIAVVARPTRERVALAATAAVALAVALGLPPVFELVTALPGFAQSVNTRLGVLVCLALALLAGFGLDDVLDAARGRAVRRPRVWAASLAAAVVVPAAVVLAHVRPPTSVLGDALGIALAVQDATHVARPEVVLPLAAVIDWLLLAGAGAVLLVVAATRRAAPRALAAAALTLVAVDLLRFGMGQNPAIPLDHARQPETPAIRELRAQRPARFAGIVPDVGVVPLPADVGMRWGLLDARGYDYPVERRYDRFWRAAISPGLPWYPPTTLAAVTERSQRALGLLAVSRLVRQTSDRPIPGAPVVYEGRDARIYANRHAMPRAWVVERQEVVRGEDAALRTVLSPRFRPASAAVVETRLPGLPASVASPAGDVRPATVREDADGRTVLAVQARRPSLVVLADNFYPGWQARVDGRRAEVHRVDYLLRGVVVPPGAHRVEFVYRPLSVLAGGVVSAVTGLLLLAALLRAAVRRRRGAR